MTQKNKISEIVSSYGSRLKSFIRKRVATVEDAEDILQDVFFKLSEADPVINPIEHISSWLYTVTRNRITDLYRKKKPEPISDYFIDNEDDDELEELGEILHETGNTPETEYLKTLIWKELESALAELPEEQRIVFEMNELQDFSFQEISELTSEPENTLISRKRYAVLHLRKRLKTLYDELINI